MERGIITITENGVVTMPTTSVWMTQQKMCDAFNVFGYDIRKAIRAIYKNEELRYHALHQARLWGKLRCVQP